MKGAERMQSCSRFVDTDVDIAVVANVDVVAVEPGSPDSRPIRTHVRNATTAARRVA